MNPNNIQNEVEHLRAETPREGARGELIYSLTNRKGQKMNTLRKATLPTLVTAVALVGGVMLMQPKAVAATPSRVAAALKKAMNYTIQSFVGEGSSRKLQSVTTVEGEKKTTKFVDANGNLVERNAFFKTSFHNHGEMAVWQNDPAAAIRANQKRGTKGVDKVEINVFSNKGKETKSIKVNGKTIEKLEDLPKDVRARVRLKLNGSATPQGVEFFDELPANASVKRADNAMVIASLGNKNGKPMILLSGQTPSEYLMDLLGDEARWNIARGVSYKGEKLDKFGLKIKGDFTPVELYVDPASALPKYLVFKGMDGMGMKIEDVYTYGARP